MLTLEALEDVIREIKEMVRKDPIGMKPTMLLIQPALQKQAMKVLYYKPRIKKTKGIRGRKKALYWR